MKNTKVGHTPGPWEMRGCYDYGIRAVFGQGGDICSMNVKRGKVEGEANAALIAAAPDLLAALIRCERLIHSAGYGATDTTTEARAAIAKAKGE